MTDIRARMPRLTGSGQSAEHGPIHTSSAFRPALEAIPAWVAARDALLALDAIRLPAPGDHRADLTAQLVEDLAAGEATADSLITAATKAATAGTALDLARGALDAARGELLRDLDDALEGSWGLLYEQLQREHTDAWTRLATLDQPAGLLDPAAAIAADRVDDYRTWRNTIDELTSIRRRYAALSRASGAIADPDAPDTWLRDLEAWELYAAWAEGFRENHLPTGEIEPIRPPWELDQAPIGSDPWIVWALDSTFAVWLPTPAELADAQQRRRAHVQRWASAHVDGEPLTPAARRREQRTVHAAMHADH